MSSIDLNSVHSPADIKKMDMQALRELAAEMRAALIRKVSACGGHVGPNLGMVEATIALHYVFDAPKDKIVYDVSHQTYPHKMLTGRMEAFTNPTKYGTVTGYTNPRESDYDLFSVGHTSTALALAAGLAKARDIDGGRENVIAVVGDGSLGGGEALEGLNYGSTLGSNFIVVINDNDMSIAHNHGGLYADLRLLRHSNGTAEPNIFKAMGYAYRYVNYGNDLPRLIEMFRAVKDIDHPVVVHINTMKGMGLPVAEAYKERFHYSSPFDAKTGTPLAQSAAGSEPRDYATIFADHILDLMKKNSDIVVLNAGTPGSIGFTPDKRREAGRRFVDVGIAEQMCVGMAAGLAKGGARPVMGVVSTFLQRAYDQLSQDVAINNQPAVFNIFYGGADGMTDETHLGFFDIALVTNIPRINYLAPTCRQEYLAMLDWAIAQRDMPVAIRVPAGDVVSDPGCKVLGDYSKPAFDIVEQGEKIALIGAGSMFGRMKEAATILKEKGRKPTLVNPRCLSALDTEVLDSFADYDIVITAEDGIVDGGFGQKVAAYLGQKQVKVLCLGLPKRFENRFDPARLYRDCGLDPDQIAQAALCDE